VDDFIFQKSKLQVVKNMSEIRGCPFMEEKYIKLLDEIAGSEK
jgi:hypothetical protein